MQWIERVRLYLSTSEGILLDEGFSDLFHSSKNMGWFHAILVKVDIIRMIASRFLGQ